MDSTRQEKIARMIQKELSEIFVQYARKLKGVLISVTKVNVSPDMSITHNNLSIFPSNKAEEILEKIVADTKSIRYELGKRIKNMRIIPELYFHIDDSLDYIDNIDRLLQSDPPSSIAEDDID